MADAKHDLSRLRIDRSTPARRGGCGGWLVAALLLVVLLLYAAWREGWVPQWQAPRGVEVRLGRVSVEGGGATPASSGTSANGYVVARTQAALSTEIQGRITEMHVEEGDRVEAGQLIARLDVRQLEAARATAQADLVRSRADLELDQLEFERREALVESGDVRLSERDAALAARDASAAAVEAMRSRLEEIEVRLDNSSVYAPFSGVITAKNAEVGEVVSAIGATGPNARGAVATLVDFDTLEVQVELAQTALAGVELGAPARIHLDAWPAEPYPGRVRQIWPTADRQKATVEVRVSFEERDDRILPQMGVRVVFLPREAEARAGGERRVWVPTAAVVGEGEAARVFVAIDGRAAERAVRVAERPEGARWQVLDGLSGSEQVVLNPGDGLADGDALRLPDAP